MNFEVEITEILKKKVVVQADNQREAEEYAELAWDKGDFTLVSENDFYSSNFKAVLEINKTLDSNKIFQKSILEELRTVPHQKAKTNTDKVINTNKESR